MDEREERVVTNGATRISLPGTQPPLRVKFVRIRSPQRFGTVDDLRDDEDKCAFRDWLADQGRVLVGYAGRHWNGWVVAEDFIADCVEVWQGVESGGGDGVWVFWGYGREIRTDFFAEARLDFWVLAERIDGPLKGRGGRFVAGPNKGHHLVH